MQTQNYQEKLGGVFSRAWSDPAFKLRLKANPNEVLSEIGIDLPSDVSLEVVENTPTKTYLTLPLPPQYDHIGDEEITGPTGGKKGGETSNVCITLICKSVGCK